MPEWLGKDWLQVIWVPILALMTTAIVTIVGKRTETKATAEANFDSRLERWIATQEARITDLERRLREAHGEIELWRDRAHWWNHKAHDMAQGVSATRYAARLVLKDMGVEPNGIPEVLRAKPIELPDMEHPLPPPKP